jgi:hypothetical protein
MQSIIRTFALLFVAMVVLSGPDGFARDPNSIGLCPPSFRMTEHDGCQPGNGSQSGRLPAHVKDDTAEQWNAVAALIDNTPGEIQLCALKYLSMQSTQDAARAVIARCQREVAVWKEETNIVREANRRAENIANESNRRAENIANVEFYARWVAGVLVIALIIGFRARIAAGLYHLFVRYLALWLRFNRSRNRFFDNAIREAENRLDCSQRPPLE